LGSRSGRSARASVDAESAWETRVNGAIGVRGKSRMS
jgi:hypothetical protein